MRLDGLDKSVVVSLPETSKTKVEKHQLQSAAEVSQPEQSGSEQSQSQHGRLGRILRIVENGKERKSKKKKSAQKEAIRVYESVAAVFDGEELGQTIDILA